MLTKYELNEIQNILLQKCVLIPRECIILRLKDALETLETFTEKEKDDVQKQKE